MMDVDDLTDDELIEEVLLRQGGVNEAAAQAFMQKAIEAAGGDEQAALKNLETQRLELVERALAALASPSITDPEPSLTQQAVVILAHDLLDERLDPGDDEP